MHTRSHETIVYVVMLDGVNLYWAILTRNYLIRISCPRCKYLIEEKGQVFVNSIHLAHSLQESTVSVSSSRSGIFLQGTYFHITVVWKVHWHGLNSTKQTFLEARNGEAFTQHWTSCFYQWGEYTCMENWLACINALLISELAHHAGYNSKTQKYSAV